MDTFSDVLDTVRFKTSKFGVLECGAPWGIRLPGVPLHVRLVIVTRGGCIAKFPGRDAYTLGAGELILSHVEGDCDLKDAETSSVMHIEDIKDKFASAGHVLRMGGDAASTSSVMAGCFEFDRNQKNPFIASLPEIIHLKSNQVQAEPGLEATIRLLISELLANSPGGDMLKNRFSDAIFVQIIRAFISQVKHCKETPSWLKALADPQIGAALNLIHTQPEAPWTVAELAAAVNMSRTAFANKFCALVQTPPIDYLTTWRMQKAVTLIRDGQKDVSELATQVGYASRSAFVKAFKTEIGHTPSEYRSNLALDVAR